MGDFAGEAEGGGDPELKALCAWSEAFLNIASQVPELRLKLSHGICRFPFFLPPLASTFRMTLSDITIVVFHKSSQEGDHPGSMWSWHTAIRGGDRSYNPVLSDPRS